MAVSAWWVPASGLPVISRMTSISGLVISSSDLRRRLRASRAHRRGWQRNAVVGPAGALEGCPGLRHVEIGHSDDVDLRGARGLREEHGSELPGADHADPDRARLLRPPLHQCVQIQDQPTPLLTVDIRTVGLKSWWHEGATASTVRTWILQFRYLGNSGLEQIFRFTAQLQHLGELVTQFNVCIGDDLASCDVAGQRHVVGQSDRKGTDLDGSAS